MGLASIIGYATFMDPSIGDKYSLQNPELVAIRGHQRFFGFPDLAGKSLEEIFDAKLNLVKREVSAITVELSSQFEYNAVLYRGVSEEAVAALDSIEANSHMSRKPLDALLVSQYLGGQLIIDDGNPIYFYAADKVIYLPGAGMVQLVRPDVLPNPDYLEKVRKAAAVHGNGFLQDFNNTTFLADRRTNLADR